MRPHADDVEFLYECMSATGEALIVTMICLNYFDVARIPGSAMLISMLLVIGGNLGAQVILHCVRPCTRSCSAVNAHVACQVQGFVLGRILLIAEPVHEKLMQRSSFYRHGSEAIGQYHVRCLLLTESLQPTRTMIMITWSFTRSFTRSFLLL